MSDLMDEFESDVVSQFSIPLLYAFLYYFSSLNITMNIYNFQARKEVHFMLKNKYGLVPLIKLKANIKYFYILRKHQL